MPTTMTWGNQINKPKKKKKKKQKLPKEALFTVFKQTNKQKT